MKQIGQKFICDRCKKEIFCEMTIERIKLAFDIPEKWETIHFKSYPFLLCDKCKKEYKEIYEKQSSELKRFLGCEIKEQENG